VSAPAPTPTAPVPPETTPADGPLHRILEGTVIDTVLTNRLDGTTAAPVNCLVSSPIYAADGQQVVIPAGSRILGTTKPVQAFGDTRLAVAFTRLVLPNGRTYALDHFLGLNEIGDAGLPIYRVLTQQVAKIHDMAERLSAVTDLVKYVAPDAPRWRTRRIDDALAASDAFLFALNGEQPSRHAYEAVARRVVAVGEVFVRFGPDDEAANNSLRAALATIDIAASAIVTGIDQTGRIRANRHQEEEVIQALEDDVADPNVEQSTTAVLDKVSAASVIRARQQDTRVQLLTALTEQLLVDAKRDRDTEAAAMNMQLGRLTRGRAVAASVVAGSAEDFRTWRQP
jgi:hypothetical protein